MSPAFILRRFGVKIGNTPILAPFDLEIPRGEVTVIIGPSGSGKTTLLRALNRLDEDRSGYRIEGTVLHDDRDLYDPRRDVNELRERIGMVFQRPVVFPTSIEANVLFGVRHLGLAPRRSWPGIVETTLARVALLEEVKDRLHAPARELSQGQKQRLSIARALALDPEVLLLDEPTASLDPHSTELIETLLEDLTPDCTMVLVTHSLRQARRLGSRAAFFSGGRLVEAGPCGTLFERPGQEATRSYLAGDRHVTDRTDG